MAELQEPEIEEESKKELTSGKKGGTGVSMLTLIIVFGVVLAVLVAGVFIGMKVMITSSIDKKMAEAGLDSTTSLRELTEDNKLYAQKLEEKIEMKTLMKDLEREDFYGDPDGEKYHAIDQVMAMPKGSTEKVLIGLSFVYRVKTLTEEEAAEAEEEEEEESLTDMKASLAKKLDVQVKSIVTNLIGSMTLEEIQTIRPELEELLLEEIRPLFQKEKMWLKQVFVTQFITM